MSRESTPDTPTDEAILARLATGDDVAAEADLARQAFRAQLVNQGVLASCLDTLRGDGPENPAVPVHVSLAALHARVTREIAPRQGRTAPRVVYRWPVMASVAGVAFVVTALVGSLNHWWSARDTGSASTASIREFRTRPSQRAELTLPDGSVAVLAPDSRIRYRADFGKTSRDIELIGQALFTVTHRGGVPFVVLTGQSRTRVLGTAFTVRRYPEDTVVRVVVAQGKVSLNSTVLGNGDLGTAVDGAKTIVTHGVNIEPELAWTEGRLVLNGIPFRNAVPELERWFGVTIVVADERLLQEPIITTLNTEGRREALTLLATALGARVTFEANRAVFSAH
jgi:transmembrane sensor